MLIHDNATSIRRALPVEADALYRLAVRSKASWGYDEAFMALMPVALAVSAEYVANNPVYVMLHNEMVVGFFGFLAEPDAMCLNDFWIEPMHIGTGLGRVMWQHALERARVHGFCRFVIESDPNAEGFYRRMGARRIGSRISPGTGRALPLLEYGLET